MTLAKLCCGSFKGNEKAQGILILFCSDQEWKPAAIEDRLVLALTFGCDIIIGSTEGFVTALMYESVVNAHLERINLIS